MGDNINWILRNRVSG